MEVQVPQIRVRLATTTCAALAINVLAAVVPAATSSDRVAAPQQRDTVFVAVSDDRGRPVAGLAASDFRISIDDRTQEVLSVAPATEPASVVLLTDRLGLTTSYSPVDLQRALTSFVTRLRRDAPGSHFALTTFDGPVVRVLNFTSLPAELSRQIGRLTTIAEDAALLDALTDACRQMMKAPTARRAIFLLYAGYRPDTSTATPELAGLMLQASGASVWAVEARIPGAPTASQPNRDLVVDRGTGITGGRRSDVASAVGAETMATQIAALIGSQYQVTYGPGGGTADSRRHVVVTRPDLRVYAPAWLRR
jgi:VWFA-related protein